MSDGETRRKRLDRIFGDVLPDTSGDERDESDRTDGVSAEQRYRRETPPHYR